MTDAAYVIVGYAVTVVALTGYAVALARRSRRARRRLEAEGDRTT